MSRVDDVLASLREERERLRAELERVELAIASLDGSAARASGQEMPPYVFLNVYEATAEYRAACGEPKTTRDEPCRRSITQTNGSVSLANGLTTDRPKRKKTDKTSTKLLPKAIAFVHVNFPAGNTLSHRLAEIDTRVHERSMSERSSAADVLPGDASAAYKVT